MYSTHLGADWAVFLLMLFNFHSGLAHIHSLSICWLSKHVGGRSIAEGFCRNIVLVLITVIVTATGLFHPSFPLIKFLGSRSGGIHFVGWLDIADNMRDVTDDTSRRHFALNTL